jgi:hypothetical protein
MESLMKRSVTFFLLVSGVGSKTRNGLGTVPTTEAQ